jgi:hypothetical protein
MSLESDLRLKDGQLSFLKGLARIDFMNVEGMAFGKTKMNFDWKDREMQLHTQMSTMELHESSVGGKVLQTITRPQWWDDESGVLKMTALDGELRVKSSQDVTWRKFQASVGKTGKLSTEGGWNASGELRGHVLNRDGKDSKRWQISGTRENPLFSEDSSSPNPLRK